MPMQLTEDELGWRRDKPIPHEEYEPIPLSSVDESKLENPAPPSDFTRKIPWFAMDMHTPAGKQQGLGRKTSTRIALCWPTRHWTIPTKNAPKRGIWN